VPLGSSIVVARARNCSPLGVQHSHSSRRSQMSLPASRAQSRVPTLSLTRQLGAIGFAPAHRDQLQSGASCWARKRPFLLGPIRTLHLGAAGGRSPRVRAPHRRGLSPSSIASTSRRCAGSFDCPALARRGGTGLGDVRLRRLPRGPRLRGQAPAALRRELAFGSAIRYRAFL
jgi:hypothetical protein